MNVDNEDLSGTGGTEDSSPAIESEPSDSTTHPVRVKSDSQATRRRNSNNHLWFTIPLGLVSFCLGLRVLTNALRADSPVASVSFVELGTAIACGFIAFLVYVKFTEEPDPKDTA